MSRPRCCIHLVYSIRISASAVVRKCFKRLLWQHDTAVDCVIRITSCWADLTGCFLGKLNCQQLAFPSKEKKKKLNTDSFCEWSAMCSCAFFTDRVHVLVMYFVHAARLLFRSERLLTAELRSDEVLEAQVLQEHSWRSTSLEVEGDVRGELCLQRGEVEVGRLLVERRCIPYRLWKENTDASLFAVPCLHFINKKKKQSSEIGGIQWSMTCDLPPVLQVLTSWRKQEANCGIRYQNSHPNVNQLSLLPESFCNGITTSLYFLLSIEVAQPLFTARGPLSGKHLYKL